MLDVVALLEYPSLNGGERSLLSLVDRFASGGVTLSALAPPEGPLADAFAEKGINIEAQYLQTNAEIGYVVVDVKEDRGYEALAELQQIDGTIKTRILH